MKEPYSLASEFPALPFEQYIAKNSHHYHTILHNSTLFIAGVGKFFEGDARDMYQILFHVLLKLPDDTWIYCGHEYTKTNLKVLYRIIPVANCI